MTRLVVIHDVLQAWETLLDQHMPVVAVQQGWTTGASGLENGGKVRSWKTVPSPDAIVAAGTPNGAMASTGTAAEPRKNGNRTHDADWLILAAVYDRGRDYDDTQMRVQRWAALIRAVTLAHPSIGGLVKRTNWVGEDYDVVTDQRQARTLGGCTVAFNVHLENVADLTVPVPLTRTSTTVTASPATP